MGYYSEVGLCLTKDAKALLEKAIQDHPNKGERVEIQSFFSWPTVHENTRTGIVAYVWENTKWYEDFAYVQLVEGLMGQLDAKDYLFILLGDDYDDCETRGAFWNNPLCMGIERKIGFA